MRALTPDERALLQRVAAGDTWAASDDELLLARQLHRVGLLGHVDLSTPERPWHGYPATASTTLALRVDAAFRGLG